MSDAPDYEVTILVDGDELVGWSSYEIVTTMLEPANHFSIDIPFDRDVWDMCPTDAAVQVQINGVCVIHGWITERLVPEDNEVVQIVGTSRMGRLVKESAPGISFAGLDFFSLVKKAVDPWFTDVTFSNARNRSILRGRGKKAKAFDKALKLNTKKSVGSHIQPGMTRGQILETLCTQAQVLFWESGDGQQLIVGEPNYDQEPQYRFFMPKKGSTRANESTVSGMGIHESVADRYSRIIVVGSGQGTDANYGAAVASRYAEVKDNPLTKEGDGRDFSAPKRLVIVRDVQTIKEAQDLAKTEQARRDINRQTFTVRAPGHGQVIAGSQPTLFTYDTMASVEDERTGESGNFYVTGCTYRGHRKECDTMVYVVPKGTRLVA